MDKKARDRVEDALSRVVPGIRGADQRVIGPKETVEFRQSVAGSKDPWRFLAASMSDGTLRAFGILLALFQVDAKRPNLPRLIGLEEPEMALHPAASGILLAGLREASAITQVMVTSHSPDLLDDSTIP